MKNKLFLLLLAFGFLAQSQTNLDSLWKVWNNTNKHDTVRLKALNTFIVEGTLYSNPDSALKLSDISFNYAKKKGLKYNMAKAHNLIGSANIYLGNLNDALKNFEGSLELMEEIKNKEGIANALNNIGSVYMEQGNLMMAIKIFTKTLKIRESIGDRVGQAAALINIGSIYRDKRDNKKSIEYYLQCLDLLKTTDDKRYLATVYGYLANGYLDEGAFETARDYLNRSLQLEKELGNELGIASCYGTFGLIASDEARLAAMQENNERAVKLRLEAIDFYSKCLEMDERMKDLKGVGVWKINMAECYFSLGQYQKALILAKEGLKLAEEVNSAIHIKNGYQTLYEIYKKTGDAKNALQMHEIFVNIKDTLYSRENQNEIVRQEVQYNFEKKNLADSLAFAKEKEVSRLAHEAQLDKEKNQKYILYGGLTFALLLGIISFRGYQRKKKDNQLIILQKQEVEVQKSLLEAKNNEILDSINYAKRIQDAILPPLRVVKKHLPQSNILYKPKDIVAGDFYWLEHIGDVVLFAAADCTGHGVPGAMVSVVCHNALNRAVREFGIINPAQILNKTRELVIEQFEKSDAEVKDGMDISLCALNVKTNFLSWAGANNPLWIIRHTAESIPAGFSIIEVKGDKQPIGKFAHNKPFTNHEVQLKAQDTIYIFTDGYQDQFGGEKGKKFKASKLKELLVSLKGESLDEQFNRLNATIESWKGKLEQVDDICIIGVRV